MADSANQGAPAPTAIDRPGGIGQAEFIAIVASMMALNAVAVDIMLPALPNMGDALGISDENSRQYVLTSYFLGFGLAQIVFGPLSDRFGRMIPLQVGMAIYVIGAFAGALSPDFSWLLAARFVQGIGAASTRVLSLAIVRDVYGGRKMAEVTSLIIMVFMAAPVIAPAAGQVIIVFADWRMIFIFMAVACALSMLWAWWRLPETLTTDRRRPLTPARVIEAFGIVLSSRIALGYGLATTATLGALFGFIAATQQIYVGIYGLGVWFPAVFAISAGVVALASFLNSRLVGRFGMRPLSHGAMFGFAAFSLLWFLLSYYAGPISFVPFLILVSIIFFFFAGVVSNFNALAMEPLGAVAGTGSAVLGFMQTVGGALIGIWVGQAFDGTATPVAFGFVAVSVATIGFVLVAERGKLFQTHNPPV
ncbi:MAG: multidrug effflux MFS transporter [Rhizobiaceae bacterium]